MTSKKERSKGSEWTKNAVNAWINKVVRNLPLHYVPWDVRSVCLLYFSEDEYEVFEIVHDKLRLYKNKETIKWAKRWDEFDAPGETLFNYGSNKIESMSKIICQWDLKINKGDNACIGISSGEETDFYKESYGWWRSLDCYHYFLDDYRRRYTRNNHLSRYSKGFGIGDKVSVHLDLGKGFMRYLINEQDQGIAFMDIQKDAQVQYRLMVGLGNGTEIEILRFRIFTAEG